jgi:hypothetical protein
LLQHRPVAVSAAVMRRDIWEQVRPLPDLLTADMVAHIRIALAGHAFYYIDEPLMAYAVHDDQQSAASPRFRNDQVSAWEMFSFDDAAAERIRRHHLGRARVSMAAADLQDDRLVQARRSLAEARALGLRATGAKGIALGVVARQPWLSRIAVAAWRLFRRPA